MQRVHAIDGEISDMRESQRAQILQLKRLEEIQSAAADQMSHAKGEQQQLRDGLGKLSSEIKMRISELNDALRKVVEDVASTQLCKSKIPIRSWEESDSDANAPTPSDQTVVLPNEPRSELPHDSHIPTVAPVASDPQKRCSEPKMDPPSPLDPFPNVTQYSQWPARQSSPIPLRPLQNLSTGHKSEKPPVPPITGGFFPRNEMVTTQRPGEVMVSPRPMSLWTMSSPRLTHTASPSPMVSPRFAPSPQRSPRVQSHPQPQPIQPIQAVQAPQILKAWQMRPLPRQNPDVLNVKPAQSQAINATSPREALHVDSSNLGDVQVSSSNLMTPRLEKSLPATERSRRVTSPTRE